MFKEGDRVKHDFLHNLPNSPNDKVYIFSEYVGSNEAFILHNKAIFHVSISFLTLIKPINPLEHYLMSL